MLLTVRTFAVLGLLTLTACASQPVAIEERNQFAVIPQSAVTPPEIENFLAPWQSLGSNFEKQLQRIEQELENCLQRVSCRQPI